MYPTHRLRATFQNEFFKGILYVIRFIHNIIPVNIHILPLLVCVVDLGLMIGPIRKVFEVEPIKEGLKGRNIILEELTGMTFFPPFGSIPLGSRGGSRNNCRKDPVYSHECCCPYHVVHLYI